MFEENSSNDSNSMGTWFWVAVLGLLVFSQYAGKGGCTLPIGPIVGPAPITEPGLHVVELYNSSYVRDLAPARLGAHNSTRVPDYIQGKGGKFERVEVTTERAGIDPVWLPLLDKYKAALESDTGEHFTIVVSNAPAKGGVEQPLPINDDEYLALVKKYAE